MKDSEVLSDAVEEVLDLALDELRGLRLIGHPEECDVERTAVGARS